MIKSITIKRSTGESLEIELADPEKSGFAISSIDGLGPTTVTLTTEKVALWSQAPQPYCFVLLCH